jgi:hypothetical protein
MRIVNDDMFCGATESRKEFIYIIYLLYLN